MDIRAVGSSHGTAHVYLIRALGTQLYNPSNCEWPRPASTPFTRFAGISGVFDWAAISNMKSICSQTGNCSVNGGVPGKSPDTTEPFFVAATAGATAWGLTGSNPTNGSVTIGTCGANGLAVVQPTSANAIVNAWSPQSYWSGGQCIRRRPLLGNASQSASTRIPRHWILRWRCQCQYAELFRRRGPRCDSTNSDRHMRWHTLRRSFCMCHELVGGRWHPF